jgi:tetratricopeptide (TPR) repeat protein
VLLLHRDRSQEAIEQLGAAVTLQPDLVAARFALGNVLARQGKFEQAAAQFYEVIRVEPASIDAHVNLGNCYRALRRDGEAARSYRGALRFGEPVDAMNSLAWLLATSSRDEVRDPVEAVRLARKACTATRHTDPRYLTTLAAAQAASGDFAAASEVIRKARALAEAGGATRLMELIVAVSDQIDARRPYRQAS